MEGRWRHKLAEESVRPGHVSYAQCGEDLIARFVFDIHQIVQPTYIDVGAHAPRELSNTYLFYTTGSSGVLIEPNPKRARALRAARRRDVVVERAAGNIDDALVTLHELDSDAVSTADPDQLQRATEGGAHRIVSSHQAATIRTETLIDRHLDGRAPDLMSIDVEGAEDAVLDGNNWARHRPLLLIIETLRYTPPRSREKNQALIDRVRALGYVVWADTFLNTIFVDESRA